jgi:hypothetical protein
MGYSCRVSLSRCGGEQRCRTSVRIEGIKEEKLCDEVLLYILLRLRKFMDDLHKPAIVYEVLVPYLTDNKTFLEAWAAGERAHAGLQGDLETLQRAGTCYYRCVLSAMKYLLKRKGVPKAAIKQLTYVVRQKYVEAIEPHLNVPVLDESHHKLIQIACQQTGEKRTIPWVNSLDRGHDLCSCVVAPLSRCGGGGQHWPRGKSATPTGSTKMACSRCSSCCLGSKANSQPFPPGRRHHSLTLSVSMRAR